MKRRVVIMNEEESMSAFLSRTLPKAFPGHEENVDWVLIHHNGRSDLERSIGRKARGWREPDVRFMVTRDNDGGNCKELKNRLVQLLNPPDGRPYKVRIVCQELECWLLGDPKALVSAYPRAERHPSFRSWTNRDPDALANASELVRKLTGTSAKVDRARAIGAHCEPSQNKSASYKQFLVGLGALLRPDATGS